MKKNDHIPSSIRHQLTIGWLYPELMSTYGDRGNIIVLSKRCEWRGIDVEIKELNVGFDHKQLSFCDLLFMGGAQDQQQKIVSNDFSEQKTNTLRKMIDSGIPGLYVCGAYQFLGKYYKEADGIIIKGLNIFDIYTENPGSNFPRLIGNIVFQPSSVILSARFDEPKTRRETKDLDSSYKTQNDKNNIFAGFENHGGRTYLGKNIKPFGKVIKGFGNNGKDTTEGAIYKNSFGTYLHGSILPKNPDFADYLIKLALEKKYDKKIILQLLDDDIEKKAHDVIVKRLTGHI